MVKRRSIKRRIGPRFSDFLDEMNKETGLPRTVISDNLVDFIEARNEKVVMKRVAQRRKKKGWFLP